MRFLLKLWPPLPVWRGLDLGVTIVVAYSLALTFLLKLFDYHPTANLGIISFVNAILLSVLLGFRNKEAYERWWEGRKLWGQLINESRNLAIKIRMLNRSPEERTQAAEVIARFATALKQHLRDRSNSKPTLEHRPAIVAAELFALLYSWKLSDIDRLLLDPHLRALMDVCGACERIQSSPVPLSYRSLLRHGTILYLVSAPWFIIGEFGYWSAAIVGLIAYFLLGIELTAENIEDPFGTDGDDLELARFRDIIEKSASEILKEVTSA